MGRSIGRSAENMVYLGTEPAEALQTWYHWTSEVTPPDLRARSEMLLLISKKIGMVRKCDLFSKTKTNLRKRSLEAAKASCSEKKHGA